MLLVFIDEVSGVANFVFFDHDRMLRILYNILVSLVHGCQFSRIRRLQRFFENLVQLLHLGHHPLIDLLQHVNSGIRFVWQLFAG